MNRGVVFALGIGSGVVLAASLLLLLKPRIVADIGPIVEGELNRAIRENQLDALMAGLLSGPGVIHAIGRAASVLADKELPGKRVYTSEQYAALYSALDRMGA